ncbi:MAG: hypothetical protein AB2L24_10545 [Mangrovibacterium sp.]
MNKHLISDTDTLAVSLGDTLFLSFDVTGDYIRYNVLASGFEYEETADLTYQLIAKKTGLAYIYASVNGPTSDNINDASVAFFVDISSFSYIIVPVEEPVLNIDVENESLRSAIQTELEDAYDLEFPGLYTLTCNTFAEGDLQLVTAEKDTIRGTFTTSTVFDLTDVILSYNNSAYTCTLEGSAPDPDYYFHLKQDLTDEFRIKYPSETINEITITTLCVMHKIE